MVSIGRLLGELLGFRRRRSRPGPPEPRIDREAFARICAGFEATGFTVIVGQEAATYLASQGAEAAYMPTQGGPGIFRWHALPSRGAVAEEVYHAEQHRRGGWEVGGLERVYALEIEAQEWLLRHAREQGWTRRERRRFRAARTYWIGRWERLTGRRYP